MLPENQDDFMDELVEEPELEVETADLTEFAEMDEVEEVSQKPRKEKPRVQKRSGSRKRRVRQQRSPLDEVLARFAGCDRCSYFLASYVSVQGQEVLETAVAESDDEWLQLAWIPTMPTLVEKSFGITIDQGDFYVEGSCPLCQRVFVYTTETEEERADFQISL